MRKVGAARIAALVGMGLAFSVAPALAQPFYHPAPTFQGKIWDGFGTSTPKPEDAEPIQAIKLDPTGKAVPPGTKAEPPAQTVTGKAREQERLMKVYLRREAVSDKIRDIGVATNNPALVEEAAYLREKAWQIYVTHSGRLLGTAVPLEPDNLEPGKPVRSAATLSQAAAGGDLSGPMRDGNRSAAAGERQTSVLREGER
jgi:hypothetical protein